MRISHVILVVMVSVLTFFGTGCRKKDAEAASTASSASSKKQKISGGDKKSQGTKVATSVEEPVNPSATGKQKWERQVYQGKPQETLRALNQLLDGWQMSRPPPLSLEEMVLEGALEKIPTAPPGQRYIIDPKSKRVVLTRQ